MIRCTCDIIRSEVISEQLKLTHEDRIVYILQGFLILLRFGITIIPSQNLQIASPNSKNTHAALYCGGIRSLWIVQNLNYIHSSDQL